MFARMLDKHDVVDFVREIEKYECLYDQNSSQYANKVLKRRIWLEIAKKYTSTVQDCKEKWRKIRIAYMRSLKLSKNGTPPKRPYYLADYLQFISPNRKVDDNIPTTNSPASPASSDDSLKLEIDEYGHLNDTDEMHQLELDEEAHEKQFERTHVDQYRSPDNNLRCTNIEKLKDEHRLQGGLLKRPKTGDDNHLDNQKSFNFDESNPRRMFLLSLLPDVETLNEEEMRTFRRQVISMLDNIITSRKSIMNLSSNN